MKVLVTAFLPFNKKENNYSMEVLKYINNVDKVVLDVVYDKCYLDITKEYNLVEYDLIIALGEARMRDVLTLELQAKNISSCSLPDNLGNIKKDEIIDKDYSEILETKVEVECVRDLVMFSEDAGKFVCNNLYFNLLKNYQSKALFIHIPECNDDESEYKKHALTINKIITNLEKRGN